MVRAAAAFLIQLPETFKVQALNQSVNHPNWIMLCNILVNSLRKKHCLVGIIRTKMYLCHSENLMPKDTKSLGNNKAPACESRGFVLKKKKVRILTHLRMLNTIDYQIIIFLINFTTKFEEESVFCFHFSYSHNLVAKCKIISKIPL